MASQGLSSVVTSINGRTGSVVLDYTDVGALPDTHAVKDITSTDISNWNEAFG